MPYFVIVMLYRPTRSEVKSHPFHRCRRRPSSLTLLRAPSLDAGASHGVVPRHRRIIQGAVPRHRRYSQGAVPRNRSNSQGVPLDRGPDYYTLSGRTGSALVWLLKSRVRG